MRFKDRILERYLQEAPAALVLERALECGIYTRLPFTRPVLDVGCGEGLFAHVLFDEKIDVGVDIDRLELARASSYGAYGELIHVPANDIPKGSGTFQTVFSNSVLEHIPDLDPVLREIRRLLAPSGNFYATVPTNYFDRYSLAYQILSAAGLAAAAESYRRFFNRFWKHHHYYDIAGWKALFERNGFTVVAVQGYEPKRIALLNDALAFLAFPAFLTKKVLNRWFLFKPLRALYSPVLASLLGPLAAGRHDDPASALAFFHLKRTPG